MAGEGREGKNANKKSLRFVQVKAFAGSHITTAGFIARGGTLIHEY